MRKAILAIVLLASVGAAAQSPTVSAGNLGAKMIEKNTRDFVPTEMQRLKLENLQLKAKLAQADQAKAQAKFQGAVSELYSYSNDVRAENKWGEEVTFDIDSLKYSGPPQKESPAKK